MQGKVIIISGGSAGIGYGMATALARQGAKIVVASRDQAKGEKAIANIARDAGCEPGNIAYIKTDICSEADNERMVKFAVETHGQLDGAINNAVFPGDFKLLADEPVETFERVMQTNVTGTFLGMKHEIRQFLAQGAKTGAGYSIINISSGATRDIAMAMAMAMAPYIASKRAVEGLTEAAAMEYARQGIRINTLLFGVFDTEKSRAMHEAMPQVLEKNAAKHHVGRFGDPVKDAGEAATFLLSERSGFITGSTMFVDGGMCL